MTYWKWKTEISDGDDYESDESLQRCLADLEKAWATTHTIKYAEQWASITKNGKPTKQKNTEW